MNVEAAGLLPATLQQSQAFDSAVDIQLEHVKPELLVLLYIHMSSILPFPQSVQASIPFLPC